MNCLFLLNGYSVTCHICSLLLLCMMLIPVACGEDAPGDAEGSRTAGSGRTLPDDAAPSTYQIFRSVQAEPHTLDLSLDAYAVGDLIHIFETLVVVHPNMELRPGAADRWESNEDGTEWTFYLREGNRWSDGRPVTAHDFEYSFKRMLDPKEAGNYAFVYYDIVTIRQLIRNIVCCENTHCTANHQCSWISTCIIFIYNLFRNIQFVICNKKLSFYFHNV